MEEMKEEVPMLSYSNKIEKDICNYLERMEKLEKNRY
jgi:hypothetical protein